MQPKFPNAFLYFKAHHGYLLIASVAIVAVGHYLSGNLSLVLPANQPLNVPLRRIIPLAFVFAACVVMHCPAADFENAGGRNAGRAEFFSLVAATVLAGGLLGSVELAVSSLSGAAVVLRSFIIWLGIGMLSARIFGPGLAWILPLCTIFPIAYLGQLPDNTPHWWNWTMQPASNVPLWLLMVCSLVTGSLALLLRSWRAVGLGLGRLR
ncbi:hypothetical protein ACTMSW_21860 [Micromonospora sp. BQ11]|uniref:hypothetical protein n=1 Tax=Micromonospora sp. BQ11 TaxID=3452212 RepID=UPI003F8C4612